MWAATERGQHLDTRTEPVSSDSGLSVGQGDTPAGRDRTRPPSLPRGPSVGDVIRVRRGEWPGTVGKRFRVTKVHEDTDLLEAVEYPRAAGVRAMPKSVCVVDEKLTAAFKKKKAS